jgi:hypothetical protein
MERRSSISWLTTISILAVSCFAILIIILHFLRPDINSIQRPTSEYAVGKYGYLMTIAFFCMSLATFMLVISLNKGIAPAAKSLPGLILLVIWAIGVLIAMIFPIDPEGAPVTTAGKIHATDGPLAFLSLTIGTILVSARFKHDNNMRLVYRTAISLSLSMLLLFISVAINFATNAGYGGILQRIFLTVVVIWFILNATRLRKS